MHAIVYLLLEVLKKNARQINKYAKNDKLKAVWTEKTCAGKYKSPGVRPTPAKNMHEIAIVIAPTQANIDAYKLSENNFGINKKPKPNIKFIYIAELKKNEEIKLFSPDNVL